MSVPVSVSVSVASQPLTPKAADDVNRRSAHFSPSCWGDHFLSYASVERNFKSEQDVQELKEKVKRMIMSPMPTSKKLVLVDDIQRLGVTRHFENEIEEVLQQIHKNSYGGDDEENHDDLHTSALRFRLLRQQGYKVSCDMFNKFKDDDGKFKKTLVNDVVGLLSLYEAAHLRMHGEDLLDEALAFTTTHLTSSVETQRLSPSLAKQVTHALHQPFWKGFTRLEARIYLSIYEEEGHSQNETLLTLAKLDFNLLQQVHQKELSEITTWWKDLDFVNKLPFARDRLVESYFWALGVYFEPEYCVARMILAKFIALITVIDDIYDVHGTADELELFAEVVERWDILAMDNLPEYMKFCFQAMLDFYTEIEEKFGEEGDLYRSHYAREAMKFQVRSYLNEVKWLYQKYTPTMDEYLSIALRTSYFVFVTTSLVGMGDIVTKDSFEWIFNEPKIVNALNLLGRLMDDMRSHKFEQKREHIPSAVECYMKENGVTEEETIIELNKLVNNAWMDINEEWLNPTTIPRQLLLLILNFARATEFIYKYEDGFTHPEIVLKDSIVLLFVEPVAI